MSAIKINKIPGHRAGAKVAATQESKRLSVTLEAIGKAADGLVQIAEELGLTRAQENQPEEITLEIDPRALILAPIYVGALRASPKVSQTAQVPAEELDHLYLRARALGLFLDLLGQFQAELSGSRLIIAAAQGREWKELVSKVMETLADERMPKEERIALKNQSREIVAQAETEEKDQKQRRDDLKDARTKANQQVEAAALRRRQLQALLQLQEQQEIEPGQLDELLHIYHDQLRVPNEDQRASKR